MVSRFWSRKSMPDLVLGAAALLRSILEMLFDEFSGSCLQALQVLC